MWPTTEGVRTLVDAEHDLIRGLAGMMVDQLVAEGQQRSAPYEYDIPLFDQWDWRQRLWILDQVVRPMLGSDPAPDAAAIWEAAIEAIFAEAGDLIGMEISDDDTSQRWRQSVVSLARQKGIDLPAVDENDVGRWNDDLARIRECIFGPPNYWRAERFRDGAFEDTQRFLCQRGLPPDFLARIPPLLTIEETQDTIDRLQSIIFRDR
ncbi:hypothetical protein V7x_52950 [Crateriforma conspicua]|uniref:Uncharacterized protein n=1 Tax=Crateriforma conspicua TaxID=2527996 RepID=A0A5C6FLK2_9PLAN|nr:hypothetical protein [Crateriforma conspicua]TWU60984.1 hypothetical protein V7x_52950 [Crateriforma conspicua]